MTSYEKKHAEAKSMYEEGLQNVREDPMPKGQKFAPKVFVKIADELGSTMSHFQSGLFAHVEFTYAHAYGGSNIDSYSLLVRGDNGRWSSVAWYEEHQLAKVENKYLIKKFEREISSNEWDQG